MKKLSPHTIYEIIKTESVKKDKKFVVGKCLKCGYTLGYVWIDDILYYDNGCFCMHSPRISKFEKRKPEDLVKFIEKNITHLRDYFENESTYIS